MFLVVQQMQQEETIVVEEIVAVRGPREPCGMVVM